MRQTAALRARLPASCRVRLSARKNLRHTATKVSLPSLLPPALRDKEAGDAVHKRRMATLQAQAATRAEEEARHTAAAAQSETQEPRRSWALRAADVAAIDALEQRQWAEKWDAEASALEAALEAPLE